MVGKNVRLITSPRLRRYSGNKSSAAAKAKPSENAILGRDQPFRQNNGTMGVIRKREARPKLGLMEARRIALKLRATAYVVEARGRFSRKKQATN